MDANANPAAVKPQKKPAIHPDWWSKTLAGAVLALTLAFAVCGLFAWWGPGGISAPNKVQFVMWMITPLWLVIFSLVYLFHTVCGPYFGCWRPMCLLTCCCGSPVECLFSCLYHENS
ncbi:hypothetical protein [Undibacterium curvum]|uniref:hypothetical protein n=1 Tax=Undibacterium curvum TaxID=2762294 RepID=UPI003D10DB9C